MARWPWCFRHWLVVSGVGTWFKGMEHENIAIFWTRSEPRADKRVEKKGKLPLVLRLGKAKFGVGPNKKQQKALKAITTWPASRPWLSGCWRWIPWG